MGDFLDHFQPDPEMPDVRRIGRMAKPLLRDAVVTYAPGYPEYSKLKVSRSRGPANDPSCPSARDASAEIDVVLYSDADSFGPLHERAWDFIREHPGPIEASLRRKLFAVHSRFLREFLDEELPEARHLRAPWKRIENQLAWKDPSAVDHLFKLVAIGLADCGLDDCGFSSFEFQTGWDRDHGLGIVMHRDRVLAAGGMTELISGPGSIVKGIQAVQRYERDDGDFSLREE